jgi:DNA-binding NarL/FixJ family response regulator
VTELTEYQLRIARLAADGHSTREISRLTNRSYSSVCNQFSFAMDKMKCSDRVHLIALLIRKGII